MAMKGSVLYIKKEIFAALINVRSVLFIQPENKNVSNQWALQTVR